MSTSRLSRVTLFKWKLSNGWTLAQLFMIISKNKVQRFIDITGYGNAAGLLYTNNALSGESTFAQLDYASSDDEDIQRDIEIKNQADKIARNK